MTSQGLFHLWELHENTLYQGRIPQHFVCFRLYFESCVAICTWVLCNLPGIPWVSHVEPERRQKANGIHWCPTFCGRLAPKVKWWPYTAHSVSLYTVFRAAAIRHNVIGRTVWCFITDWSFGNEAARTSLVWRCTTVLPVEGVLNVSPPTGGLKNVN